MVELLAPAGDMKCLKAAVFNGADAVYIGGKVFSARQGAGNFDDNEIIEAIKFCHTYGVKVYVALNTLMDNSELNIAVKYAGFLYEQGIEALIVQDIGLIKCLRENYPDFELHASTQMTVHNLDGVNYLYNMGIKRVVLSRELSLREIEYICKNTKAEIEVFAHGALCICFSGQCLMSSMIGGRSGNRGRCAQPCRMEYSIDNGKNAYYLSPKDLCTYNFTDKLIDAGVASLKIEGRMKRPEYVATVTNAYKNAIDGTRSNDDMQNLTQIFNRDGFTSAFMFCRQGKEMMSYERPKNWGTYLGCVTQTKGKFSFIKLDNQLSIGDGIEILSKEIGAPVSSIVVDGKNVKQAFKGDTVFIYLDGAKNGDVVYKSLDSKLIQYAQKSYEDNNIKKAPIFGEFICKKDSNVNFKVWDEKGNTVNLIGDMPEAAINREISSEIVNSFLNKTGDTNFYFKNIDFLIENGLSLSASSINKLRRNALNELSSKIQGKRQHLGAQILFDKRKSYKEKPDIVVRTGMLDIAKAAIDSGCKKIFYGGESLRINKGSIYELIKYANGNAEIIPWFPDILIDDYETIKKFALNLKNIGINSAYVENLGMYSYLRSIGVDCILGRSFNIYNSKACDEFENEGCFLSQELNSKQIKNIISTSNKNVYIEVYGRTKLMVSRQCIIGSSKGYGKEKCPCVCENKVHYLKDRVSEVMPIYTDNNCMTHIYSSKLLCLLKNIKEVINLKPDYLELYFIDEDYDDVKKIVKIFKECVQNNDLTLEAREYIESNKERITEGHFYRSVL